MTKKAEQRERPDRGKTVRKYSVICTLDCKYKVTTHPTPFVIYCHLASQKIAKIRAQQIDIQTVRSAKKKFKISQQLLMRDFT